MTLMSPPTFAFASAGLSLSPLRRRRRAARAPSPGRDSLTTVPPIIRATSSTRAASLSRSTDVSVRPARTFFSIRKCVVAWAAICGRCVMQSTWKPIAERAQSQADNVGHASANARVDFVKDERLPRLIPRGHRLQRQHHTRQFPAGDNPRQRSEILPWVGRHEELARDRSRSHPIPPGQVPLH